MGNKEDERWTEDSRGEVRAVEGRRVKGGGGEGGEGGEERETPQVLLRFADWVGGGEGEYSLTQLQPSKKGQLR